MKTAVVVFPGSNCDHDCYRVLKEVMGYETEFVWHGNAVPEDTDLVVLPGGFSYGDYLRPGVMAKFSPVGRSVIDHARKGKFILGICNGFQILIEMGLLPGALIPNKEMRFICKPVYLKTVSRETPFTRLCEKQVVSIPIAHGFGNYRLNEDEVKTLEDGSQIVFRYSDEYGKANQENNPKGSSYNIAGVCNSGKNVMGMMPHPERASEEIMGSTDGRLIFESLQ